MRTGALSGSVSSVSSLPTLLGFVEGVVLGSLSPQVTLHLALGQYRIEGIFTSSL